MKSARQLLYKNLFAFAALGSVSTGALATEISSANSFNYNDLTHDQIQNATVPANIQIAPFSSTTDAYLQAAQHIADGVTSGAFGIIEGVASIAASEFAAYTAPQAAIDLSFSLADISVGIATAGVTFQGQPNQAIQLSLEASEGLKIGRAATTLSGLASLVASAASNQNADAVKKAVTTSAAVETIWMGPEGIGKASPNSQTVYDLAKTTFETKKTLDAAETIYGNLDEDADAPAADTAHPTPSPQTSDSDGSGGGHPIATSAPEDDFDLFDDSKRPDYVQDNPQNFESPSTSEPKTEPQPPEKDHEEPEPPPKMAPVGVPNLGKPVDPAYADMASKTGLEDFPRTTPNTPDVMDPAYAYVPISGIPNVERTTPNTPDVMDPSTDFSIATTGLENMPRTTPNTPDTMDPSLGGLDPVPPLQNGKIPVYALS